MREILTPIRKITQVVRPVIENIQTIVAKSEKAPDHYHAEKMYEHHSQYHPKHVAEESYEMLGSGKIASKPVPRPPGFHLKSAGGRPDFLAHPMLAHQMYLPRVANARRHAFRHNMAARFMK